MLREKRVPSGPRPDFSPSKAPENYDPGARARASTVREPTRHASSRNTLSLFSFGGQADDNLGGSYEFLPSPSFDDLQTSINSSNDLDFDRPSTMASSVTGGNRTKGAMSTSTAPTEVRSNSTSRRPPTAPRPTRAGSIVRRQSTSARQSSVSSTSSAATGSMEPPSLPLAARTRRQSQYPPISGSAMASAARAPRKSTGSGVTEADSARTAQKRRPSLAPSVSPHGLSDSGGASTRVNIGGAPTYMDGARGLTASRAAKTKSLQPPSRQGQTHLSAKAATPDHSRSSSFAGRSPGRPNGRGSNTPSSTAKRMSAMPGMTPSSSHATGLGARTVSPTDARRAKRLSVLQKPPPMPNTPPTPQTETSTIRTSSRSPSMLPRKASTPSSSRTTPDPNRKSYSSGLSNASIQSHNTSRTSTGSLQPRMSLPPSSSRLPTPKPRSTHSSAGNNEEEEVPPVPAIPKAYESPKESPAEQPFFNKRKSSMPFDASSINSTSTNSLSGRASFRDLPRNDREQKPQKCCPASTSDDQQNSATLAKKKSLQPLRLPPLNLLPLSTPTTAKIAALEKDPASADRLTTPPPRRLNSRTPTTPMTASKASVVPRKRDESRVGEQPAYARRSSSIHALRPESSSQIGEGFESSKPIPMSSRQTRQAVSPFISSSLPKSGDEQSFMPRSKTCGDVSAQESIVTEPHRPARLTGPRAQQLARPAKIETPSTISSPEEPTTPSSATSLRRKLSLGWKRNTSKNNVNTSSHAANERKPEQAPQPPKHNKMPPPRVPTSAALSLLNNHSVPSPSPSVKSTTYLDSKRRKSSISHPTAFGVHDRTRSDPWGLGVSPKKEQSAAPGDRGPPSARYTSSVVQKMLTSKSSGNTIKATDRWTADLDKDDMAAEGEVKRLGLKRKDTEQAAATLDALYQRATPKDYMSPQLALQKSKLNIFERGEIIDYKEIYFTGTETAAKHVGELAVDTANFGYDDERGDYSIVPGDHLSYRYEIVDVLGKGSFGQVVRCVDHKNGGLVAVKIIRNKKRFHQQALVEVNILQKLREWDPKNRHSMVNFTQSFYFRGHLCISTELLDMNLYEFIKSNGFKGFNLKIVRRFTKQILSSLLLLKQHKVIHCDLKPENVLLAHPLHSEIKVIDFGSSCFENEKVYTYIQSRFYRSPEVILGMTYGMPIDMWSLGCILAELYTGVPIFPGENEQEQLACIMEVFGPPGKHLIDKSTRKKLFFDSMGKPRLTVSSKGRRRRPSSKSLDQVLKCNDEAFLDFLMRCLRWDPDTRMKPEEAIRHEFLSGQKTTAPFARTAARNDSPIKRNTILTTPSGSNRPLPEPPATSFKNNTAVRSREPSGASPNKTAVPGRRQSTVSGFSTTAANTRTSTGPALAPGNSGLPRVTRSTSGTLPTGMASAGASAAMNRRV